MANKYGLEADKLYLFKEFPKFKDSIDALKNSWGKDEIQKEAIGKIYYATVLLTHKGFLDKFKRESDGIFTYNVRKYVEDMLSEYVGKYTEDDNLSPLQLLDISDKLLENIILLARKEFTEIRKIRDTKLDAKKTKRHIEEILKRRTERPVIYKAIPALG